MMDAEEEAYWPAGAGQVEWLLLASEGTGHRAGGRDIETRYREATADLAWLRAGPSRSSRTDSLDLAAHQTRDGRAVRLVDLTSPATPLRSPGRHARAHCPAARASWCQDAILGALPGGMQARLPGRAAASALPTEGQPQGAFNPCRLESGRPVNPFQRQQHARFQVHRLIVFEDGLNEVIQIHQGDGVICAFGLVIGFT